MFAARTEGKQVLMQLACVAGQFGCALSFKDSNGHFCTFSLSPHVGGP
jgi:hypothetical protein